MVGSGSDFGIVSRRLRCWERGLVLLDYDGTLVPIVETPDLARPPPHLCALLRDLTSAGSLEVGIVSGRSVSDLRRMLPLDGLWLAGQHGAEAVTPQGKYFRPPHLDQLRRGIGRLAFRAASELNGLSGAWLEEKGCSLALHYRLASPRDAALARNRFAALANRLLSFREFCWKRGKKVLEVIPRAVDKGSASELLVRHTGIARDKVIYAGDDETDEDAFRALRASTTVLVSNVERRTRARYRFSSPDEVVELLSTLHG
jgi:trehalose 6-phosphate phosphatase